MTEWLDTAARIKAEWGMPLFVVVSYTATCLFAVGQVRAIRLDRSYAGLPAIGRMRTRALAFVIGAPLQFLVGYLWGLPFEEIGTHAIAAGLLVSVVADIWIAVLHWRGCDRQAEIFKVSRRVRSSDPDGDNTGEMTRL